MTHERLHQLLENPALLSGMPYEELKTLALSYPYAHNLRYLLALKSHHELRPDASRTLTTASVYSLNRSKLYALIAPQKIVQHEEVLELKPIESLQKTLETRIPVSREVVEEAARLVLTNTAPQVDVPVRPVEEVVVVEIPAEKKWAHLPVVPQKTSFGVWISQFNSPCLDPSMPPEAPVEEEAPALGDDPVSPKDQALKQAEDSISLAHRLAERSVQENKEIASETLARLFWLQGHKEKSLAMYQRLSLLFPEKSAYFAAEIDKLKK